jgi:hypothetical protein
MTVFIANFGQENYLWPKCLEQGTVATINREDAQPFWEKGDRKGFIEFALANMKTARGQTPTRPVASRWFSLMNIVAETADDIWIHRAKDELWWTTTRQAPFRLELQPSINPARDSKNHYGLHKPADPWSDRTRRGGKLSWDGLHPKARDFLFTEGTLQQLSPDYAAYAVALINGDDLSPWHDLPLWKSKVATAGKGAVTTYDARQKAIWRMANTVKNTVAQANGQQVLRTVKNKLCAFTDEELKTYIDQLISDQEGVCMLTGLQLQFDGEADDKAMLCSLDRIDSDGHYEPGNLQVVCQFVNSWKSDSRDAEFRRLLGLVRAVTP